MMLARREVAMALLLALSGALAWWLQREARPPPPAPEPTERRPDYIVEGLSALTMDTAGRPDRRLTANELRHYPDDGSSELDDPRLLVYDDDAPPWQARADTGWINADGDEVLLQQRVRLERDATDTAAPLVLRTSEMLVLPETDYAETARFVEIDSGDDWVTAQHGMRAWLGEAVRVKLSGRVRARYGGPDPAAGEALSTGAPTSEP